MKIYLILLFIIFFCSINKNTYERYYTYFKPFELKTAVEPINTYIQDLFIFSTYFENIEFIKELIKVLLTNTKLMNLKIELPNKNLFNITDDILTRLNNNNIQFSILPVPLIYPETNNYPYIRSLINISKTSFYMIYNSKKFGRKKLRLKDFVLNDIPVFGTTEKYTLSYKITKFFLKNINKQIPKYKIVTKPFNQLIDELMNENLNIITFLDGNPSRKLENILNNDPDNKIYIQELGLDIFDINEKYDYIYNEVYIKYNNPSKLYPNNKYRTISFNNTLLTNNVVPDKIIIILIRFILEHKRFINKNLDGYNISNLDEFLPLYSFITHRAIHKIFNNLKPLTPIHYDM
jgi:hypothetical protein